jgi:hypothetical protein
MMFFVVTEFYYSRDWDPLISLYFPPIVNPKSTHLLTDGQSFVLGSNERLTHSEGLQHYYVVVKSLR